MAEPKSARPKATARTSGLSIGEKEKSILAVYPDMIENDDLDGMLNLMRRAGIGLRPDPTTAILRHYWLGTDRGYDVNVRSRISRLGRPSSPGVKNCDEHGEPSTLTKRRPDEQRFGRMPGRPAVLCAAGCRETRCHHGRPKRFGDDAPAGS
jgi:hypothetical protein